MALSIIPSPATKADFAAGAAPHPPAGTFSPYSDGEKGANGRTLSPRPRAAGCPAPPRRASRGSGGAARERKVRPPSSSAG
ncbi:hypothetical protein EN816_30890 [Mesorhizobium sp. M8A.F.Ca.ET.173.01.1.1]|nr:hypothetical protein EN816_30890 [Mesorhizobium sp. M8A.F.Ca.ET.173.01.1.1]